MINAAPLISMLWSFSARTPLQWRNNNSGLLASPNMRTMDWRSHPTAKAYGGHLSKAKDLTKRVWTPPYVGSDFKLGQASQGVESEAAVAFAMTADTARAESLAQDFKEAASFQRLRKSLKAASARHPHPQGGMREAELIHASVQRPLRIIFRPYNLPVAHVDDAVAVLRRLRIVSNHQHGLS
jgi:hypothetical protein